MTAPSPPALTFDTAVRLPNRPLTYSAQIVAAVRDALFEEQLGPGDFLGTEKDLSGQFGVSRIVARDALRTLEAAGVVEIRVGAGGGARIARGNPELFAEALSVQLKLIGVTVEEINEAQAAIEIMAARLAAINATPSDLDRIDKILLETETRPDDVDAYTKAGLDFHLAVADASYNRVLKIQITSLRHVMWPRRNRTLTLEYAAMLHDIHKGIYRHIAAGEAEAAAEAMRAHMSRVKTRRMREHGELSDTAGCC